jgi:hypothetical protein
MTPFMSSNGHASPGSIRFADFEVSWVGEGPTADLLCFGSENGKLRLATMANMIAGASLLAVESNEAINGAAFYGRSGAVSTRSEVVLFTLPPIRGEEGQETVFPAGAHGVIATAAGQFVAPLGRNGFLVWKPSLADVQHPITCRAKGDGFYYFYRVITLGAASSEVLVGATRRGGVVVAAAPKQNEDAGFNSITFPGLDVIDVCPLDSDGGLAVAALGADCTLVFIRDVQSDRRPIALKLNGIEGTAYNLFCTRGHLFLLTSRGLYVLRGLARRFLEGEPVGRQTTVVSEVPLKAVDANLVYERWLLVVMADCTLLYDVEQLTGSDSDGLVHSNDQNILLTSLTPAWQYQEEPILTTAADLAMLSAG